ncbi:hypothetical protein [Pseudoduganella violaceinigra]|uniref:hypothetical protein n=1 Tax=Pseudoduganella violaceinigra TaxID=246602 RepID=UPI0004810CE4|nr:hypothetical protein [Pseudoduganella violaceinigra]
MREKIVNFFGFCLFALVIFILTLLVIRGAVTIVTWATIDSGWAQAIGSVIAIFSAFILGERQAAKARKDALDLVRIEMQHKRQAILELCRAAKCRSDLVRKVFVTEYDFAARYSLYHHDLIRGILTGMESAPAYEIGSAEAINAFMEIKIQCGFLIEAIDNLDQDPEFKSRSLYPTMSHETPHVRQRNILIHCNKVDELFEIVSKHMDVKDRDIN